MKEIIYKTVKIIKVDGGLEMSKEPKDNKLEVNKKKKVAIVLLALSGVMSIFLKTINLGGNPPVSAKVRKARFCRAFSFNLFLL